MSEAPMIEARNVWKRYHGPFGGGWVLRDLNFTIPRGVSVGIVGKNGAGKSTLLRMLGGMDMPDKGEIIERCRVSWPIGLSGGFQNSMTGRQNVKFVSRIQGGNKHVDQVIKEVQDFAEIGAAFDKPIATYSSGMKSRLGFGLSLAFDFDVYLSDEATAVGDVTFKKKATKAFKERVGRSSLIMVSHQIGILRDLCQSGIFLHEGQAIWYEKIDDALDDYYQSIGQTPAHRKKKKPGKYDYRNLVDDED
jgi:capsular polysaccharide transport system ATP-binding protein